MTNDEYRDAILEAERTFRRLVTARDAEIEKLKSDVYIWKTAYESQKRNTIAFSNELDDAKAGTLTAMRQFAAWMDTPRAVGLTTVQALEVYLREEVP